jgi:hypothetical protein
MMSRFMGFSVEREDGAVLATHSLFDGLTARWCRVRRRAGAALGALCVVLAAAPAPGRCLGPTTRWGAGGR